MLGWGELERLCVCLRGWRSAAFFRQGEGWLFDLLGALRVHLLLGQ